VKKSLLMGCTLALATSFSVAQTQTKTDQASGLKLVLGMDIGDGGEKLASARYTDGSSDTIKSGGGVQFKVGVQYPTSTNSSLLATVGYEVDDTSAASNGSIKFQRFPVELLSMWRVGNKVRLGGGLRYASNPKLSGSGVASSLGTYSLKSKLGLVAQGEYLYSEKLGLTLRAISEKFEYQGKSINANHVQLGVNYYH
jgi:hypothetical protein